MQRGDYTLTELTELADVSTRTVRYYIAEGLLPPPDSAGPRATYSQGHLDRLRLIGLMKEAYLPLREIRRRLDVMTDNDVATALSEGSFGMPPEAAPMIAEERDDASSYLRRIMRDARERGDRQDRPASSESRAAMRQQTDELRRATREHASGSHHTSRQISGDIGSQWRRVELGPDVELLIREDAFERNQSRVEWLINWAQRVFR